MKKFTLSLVIFMFILAFINAQNTSKQNAEKYLSLKGSLTFTFIINDINELDTLTEELSILNYDPKTNTVYAWANEQQFRNFETRNIPFQVNKNENEVDENLIYDVRPLHERSAAATLDFPLSTYPTYDEYVTQMQQFQTDYSALVKTFSIGATTEGDKDIWFVKISDNVTIDEKEPKLLFTSSMHGDEIAGYPMMLSLIDYILTVYNDTGHADHTRVKKLVDNAEIWINPNANPDGTYYNDSTNTSVTQARRQNANGIDLNRNYPDNVAGPHANGHTSYEIETQHFMTLADNNHFVIAANFHGGVELVNYPFDNAYVSQYTHPDGNWFEFVSVEYANHAQTDSDALGDLTYMTVDYDSNVYPSPGVTHGAEWYRVYGGRQDYMNYYHQCKEVTIELSGDPNPDFAKIIPESELVNHWLYNKDALLDYLTQGLYGFRGVVKDATTGNPIENATVTIVGHDAYGSHTVSDVNFGDFYRPIKAGTYEILFEADCYQPFTLSNQTITDYITIDLGDITLTSSTDAAPSNITVTNVTSTGATISWDAINNANYDYQYKETSSSSWLPFVNTSNTSIDLTGLSHSTQYEVQVRSTCSTDSSAWSSSVIFTTTEPAPCEAPANITISNITDTSATVSWDAVTDATYEYQYQELSAPGWTTISTSNTSVNITSLTEDTYYEVQVRSNCTDSDSPWSSSVFFTTTSTPLCSGTLIDTFPYTESFESGLGDWTQDTTDDFDWTVDDNGTGTNNTGPTDAFDGTWYIYTEAGDRQGLNNAIINSPCFDLHNKSSATFSFYYHRYGSNIGTLTLQYSINDGSTWTDLWSMSNSSEDLWKTDSIDLTPHINNYLRLRFIGIPSGNRGDMAIDNINLTSTNDVLTYSGGSWSSTAPAVATAPSDTTGGFNALIVDGTYNVNTNIVLNDITINSGASIEVANGQSLTLNGDITNNGNLILNSVSNEYSSLIVDGTVTGDVSYKRHVNAYDGITGNDLISAPVVGQTFGNFATDNPNIFENPSSGLQHQKLFGPFNKITGTYQVYSSTNDASVTLDSGIGYRAARDASEDGNPNGTTFTFTGSVNTGIVNIPISNTSPFYAQWNLIGNPYPSYINPIEFIATNFDELNPVNVAIYGYNQNVSDKWTVVNSANAYDKKITPGQGFFVATDTGGTITFSPSMRTIGTGDDFIAGRNSNSISHLKINLAKNTASYATDFYFTENASSGLDPGYDASVFGGSAPSFAIYSHLVSDNEGVDMAIQSLNHTDLDNNAIVPIGINANQGEQITISISNTSLPDNIDVYLEDTLTSTYTLLNESDYIFTPNTNLNGTGRFYLNFQNGTLSQNENEIDKLLIYNTSKPDIIHINGILNESSEFKLIDLHGRTILNSDLKVNTQSQQINLPMLSKGVYVIQIQNSFKTISKKIIIR